MPTSSPAVPSATPPATTEHRPERIGPFAALAGWVLGVALQLQQADLSAGWVYLALLQAGFWLSLVAVCVLFATDAGTLPKTLNELLSSIASDDPLQTLRSTRRCEAGQQWEWDGVRLKKMCRASPLTPHPSPLTPHSSLLTPHSSLLTPHPSPLTPHSSPLTPHSSLLTPHSSLLTPHSSLLSGLSGLSYPHPPSGHHRAGVHGPALPGRPGSLAGVRASGPGYGSVRPSRRG